MANFALRRQRRQAQYFVEPIDSSTGIDMVFVPGGSFLMGSPEDESGRDKYESPQHEVTVPAFFMGRYPITQAQWEAVAALPMEKQSLEANPSYFEGENNPVEKVSWYDATEFCARLAKLSQRPYRLPSEAEWEYACRAGTTRPFYFGKTLSTEVANYESNYAYGNGLTGEYQEKTTPVNHYGIANVFGLCDLHGNVWEWCQDHWHDSYKSAPTDGSAWLSEAKHEDIVRVLRGGSWNIPPRGCRSASRGFITPLDGSNSFGFRIVCNAS